MIGYFDRKAPCLGIDHENGQQPLDLLAEAVLGGQDRPIGAFLQVKGKLLVAFGVGGETLRGNHFAQLPGAGIGKVGFRFDAAHATVMKMVMAITTQLGSLHAFRLLEAIYF